MNKLLFVLMAMLSTFQYAEAQSPVVSTKYGKIEGISQSGLKIFLGVPFAEAPVGKLRWKEPQPLKSWTGIKAAKEFGPDPMQKDIFGDMNFRGKGKSEDCLYLNIWTPADKMDEKLAVVIYFNGGGLMAGSGSEPRYEGKTMARHGIVAITANYREGVFGFLAHPDLRKESTNGTTGNYGFLDQVAAIKWVKENISAFGGDPDKITIVGESAGSISVSALMCSPLSRNLINKVMASSGANMVTSPCITMKEAEKDGVRLLKEHGDKTIEQLRAMPANEVEDLLPYTQMSCTVVDGYFIDKPVEDILSAGEQAQVPCLIGWNSMENSEEALLKGKEPTLDNLKSILRPTFKNRTDDVISAYGLSTAEAMTGKPASNLASDMFIAFATWKWTNMLSKTSSQNIYRYLYCHPRPSMVASMNGKIGALAGGVRDMTEEEKKAKEPKFKGAGHSWDIEYAMGNLPTNRVYDWQPDDYEVSDVFSSYYANFIKTGDPNGLGLPKWDPVRFGQVPPVMQIDVDTHETKDAALEKRYELMDKIYKEVTE